MPSPARYRGRFAPSPTGPLHIGSLLAALASYLDARASGGDWLLRLEDIDPPREMPAARALILASLQAHALLADAPVLCQSTRADAYADAVQALLANGRAYWCTCSRQQLAHGGGEHAHDCPRTREQPLAAAAVRLRSRGVTLAFHDLLCGPQQACIHDDVVIRRRDGLFSYQLAVVVDDAFQRVSHVIRGRDLLDSTPYQLLLQRWLGLPSPAYGHLPLLLGTDGHKLSKQNHAPALDDATPARNLRACLQALGQPPPPTATTTPGELLAWGLAHWDRAAIPAHDLAAP